MKPASIAARLGWGVVLPMLLFGLYILVIVFAVRVGQGFAPAGVLVLSVFAFPVMLLVNCWVLLVDWQSRSSLVGAGFVVPVAVSVFMTVLIQTK